MWELYGLLRSVKWLWRLWDSYTYSNTDRCHTTIYKSSNMSAGPLNMSNMAYRNSFHVHWEYCPSDDSCIPWWIHRTPCKLRDQFIWTNWRACMCNAMILLCRCTAHKFRLGPHQLREIVEVLLMVVSCFENLFPHCICVDCALQKPWTNDFHGPAASRQCHIRVENVRAHRELFIICAREIKVL